MSQANELKKPLRWSDEDEQEVRNGATVQLALPFIYTFAAGAIAGCTELLLLYPLDVVKTRQQLDTGKSGMGMVQTFRSIVANEGNVLLMRFSAGRLYRGIVPPLMLEAPKRAVKFGANGYWGSVLTNNGQKKNTLPLATLTGALAGATESFVVTPFELVKIRLQDKKSTFKGPLDVIRHSFRTSGPLGWNMGYFGCIFAMKSVLPKATTKQGELVNNLAAGTVGGFVGTTLNTPFDVVKSRVQLHGTGEWAFPTLFKIARSEGLGGLYKGRGDDWSFVLTGSGFAPKVLRLAPGGGVLLLVVEALSAVFRKQLGPPYI
ncbi:Mitochondrial 2-oxodicarboxylate carrier 1 [Saitozyma sp. JCM 24511]|nr:Mitochondrial 2-oxodicarboxylate carrier 1 [Saitozyma sp. JCM 24511]